VTSIKDLVGMLGKVLGRDLKIEPSVGAEGATRVRCPDISKMRGLGYEPQVDLEEGLRRTSDWYRHNPSGGENRLL
jgi:UDP-glucose 4-epimerase